MTSPLPSIVVADLDGVPVIWSERPGPLAAGLVFRVGWGDEPAPKAGLCHLIEHLTLFGLREREYGFNGTVDHRTTTFTVQGTSEEVVDFLAGVTSALGNLPLDRLNHERRVLATESESADFGPVEALAALRYGPSGLGARVLQDLSLDNINAEDLQAFAARYFNRGNAALWLTGPPPPDLQLNLRHGERAPAPRLLEIEQALPAWFEGPPQGTAVSFVVPYTAAGMAALRIIEHRVQSSLRFEEGLSYQVSTALIPLTAERAEGVLIADAAKKSVDEVSARLIAVLEALVEVGPDESDIERYRNRVLRNGSDPGNLTGILHSDAEDLLVGTDQTWLSTVEDIRTLPVSTVHAALRELVASAIVTSPSRPTGRSLELTPIAEYSTSVVEGTVYRPSFRSFGYTRSDLIVGDAGVTFIPRKNKRPITVRFDDCVLLIKLGPGRVELIGADAFRLDLDASLWRSGGEAIRRVLDAVPSERQVRISSEPDDPEAGGGQRSPAWRMHVGPGGAGAAVIGSVLWRDGGWLTAVIGAVLGFAAIVVLIPALQRRLVSHRVRRSPDGTLLVAGAAVVMTDLDISPAVGGASGWWSRLLMFGGPPAGLLTITSSMVQWEPRVGARVAGVPVIAFPLESVLGIEVGKGELPSATRLSLSLTGLRDIVFEVRAYEDLLEAVETMKPLAGRSTAAHPEAIAFTKDPPLQTLSALARWWLPAAWAVAYLLLLTVVSDASPDEPPAIIGDWLTGVVALGSPIAVVFLLCGARAGLYVSLAVAVAGGAIGVYDLVHAPLAGRWEVGLFAALIALTLTGWRPPDVEGEAAERAEDLPPAQSVRD